MIWTDWAIYAAIAVAVVVILWMTVAVARARQKPEPAAAIEPPEPIQKYDRFPEPKPLKTVEVREDLPWDDLPK